MKTMYKTTAALMLSLPLSMACFAEEAAPAPAAPAPAPAPNAPAHPGMGMGKGMGGGMMGGMSAEQQEERIKVMQDHMLELHDLSNQILAEKDPAKKETLKKQQRDLMISHRNQMMQQMMGGHGRPMKAPMPEAQPAAKPEKK